MIFIFIIVPIGFYSKFYSGPAKDWVNNSLGGVLYEIFWCLLVFMFFVNIKIWKITLSVFIATCILEILQLWHPPFLELIRSYFIGRTILGTSFSWFDFIYYFIGCGIGYLLLNRLQRLNS
ncbi:DUF2809 domain-containing protein [bacterium BMS3Abin03]|nr:DUF2809 domain-containing protein [bacterium BMS3Abin03]MCG6958388.1 DUF2809 domain-containing protein [bacterium BMS3Abin03]